MAYCIINKTNGNLEGYYYNFKMAEIMARNLSNYYDGINTYAITKDSTHERPSEQQMYRINQIEEHYNIPFTGITRKAATKFLSEHISKARELDK